MARKRSNLTLDQRAALPFAEEVRGREFLKLNRRDICLREINAAVRALLIDEDPIPAHLLASAATEIMSALSQGKPGVGLNDMRALMNSAGVSSDKTTDLFQSLLHPYNFLKHSSSDMTVENEFPIDFILITIYNAIHSYKVLFGKLSGEMMVFYGMLQAWRSEWWEGEPGYEDMFEKSRVFALEGASFQLFCARGRDMLDMAKKRSSS